MSVAGFGPPADRDHSVDVDSERTPLRTEIVHSYRKGYSVLLHLEKKTILKRLHYLQGQLRGIEKMIEDDRPLNDIFIQLKAAEEGVHKALYEVFEEQLKKHLAEVLSQRLAACPGNCSDAERLRFTREQFAQLDLKGVIESLAWLTPKKGEGNKGRPRS